MSWMSSSWWSCHSPNTDSHCHWDMWTRRTKPSTLGQGSPRPGHFHRTNRLVLRWSATVKSAVKALMGLPALVKVLKALVALLSLARPKSLLLLFAQDPQLWSWHFDRLRFRIEFGLTIKKTFRKSMAKSNIKIPMLMEWNLGLGLTHPSPPPIPTTLVLQWLWSTHALKDLRPSQAWALKKDLRHQEASNLQVPLTESLLVLHWCQCNISLNG